MKNIKNTGIYLSVLFVFLYTITAYNQGCSDAGFCTINSLKPNESHSLDEKKNQIKTGISYGKADHSIFVIANYVEYDLRSNKEWSVEFKLTSLYQNGNGISTFGISDLIANINHVFAENATVIVGMKLALNYSGKEKDNLPLPMDYQSSLGTFDGIAGVSYEIKKLQLILAYQQPLWQNENEFLAEQYPADSELSSFQSTNKFIRSADVMFRVSYPLELTDEFKITPGILPIYHLSTDKYTDVNEIEQEIEGSDGLTLNTNLYFDYEVNSSNAFQLNFAMPLIVREVRPDGLTRSYLVSFEYRYKF